jgi:threonine/homoserine efflux transporter RhtA
MIQELIRESVLNMAHIVLFYSKIGGQYFLDIFTSVNILPVAFIISICGAILPFMCKGWIMSKIVNRN